MRKTNPIGRSEPCDNASLCGVVPATKPILQLRIAGLGLRIGTELRRGDGSCKTNPISFACRGPGERSVQNEPDSGSCWAGLPPRSGLGLPPNRLCKTNPISPSRQNRPGTGRAGAEVRRTDTAPNKPNLPRAAAAASAWRKKDYDDATSREVLAKQDAHDRSWGSENVL